MFHWNHRLEILPALARHYIFAFISDTNEMTHTKYLKCLFAFAFSERCATVQQLANWSLFTPHFVIFFIFRFENIKNIARSIDIRTFSAVLSSIISLRYTTVRLLDGLHVAHCLRQRTITSSIVWQLVEWIINKRIISPIEQIYICV